MGTKKGEIKIGNWVAIDKNINNRKNRPNLRFGKTIMIYCLKKNIIKTI